MTEPATDKCIEERKARRKLEAYPAHEAPNTIDWWMAWEGQLIARIEAERARADELQERLDDRSWDTLMVLLDEHWPEDIFPTTRDRDEPNRDPGPRIVALIRWVDAERARADRLVKELREDHLRAIKAWKDERLEKVERIAELEARLAAKNVDGGVEVKSCSNCKAADERIAELEKSEKRALEHALGVESERDAEKARAEKAERMAEKYAHRTMAANERAQEAERLLSAAAAHLEGRGERIAALERQRDQWRFVPDDDGGHFLSVPTGHKWRPESWHQERIAELEKSEKRALEHALEVESERDAEKARADAAEHVFRESTQKIMDAKHGKGTTLCAHCKAVIPGGDTSEAVAAHAMKCAAHPLNKRIAELERRNQKGDKLANRVMELAEFYVDLDDAPEGAVPAWDLVAVALQEWGHW